MSGDVPAKIRFDPKKKALWDSLEGCKIDEQEITQNGVLVALHIRPEKSAGGIYYADTTREEDKNQGKVGLIVKLGQHAYKSDHNYDFTGEEMEVGDWVVFRVVDGWPVQLNGKSFRLFRDQDLRWKTSTPDLVY
ncbi:co-chaperone GroES family protein [Chelatococcus sp.]|uniref:co-chaperone GroES family protein n=1 Tax=Chelatococcus sp. TaxID=1953771 RepID=UPI001EC18276|nr:co-chaperone GroES family protein [Chelatococcus sp.]MBX3547315.1 co-chaperone GroES [Chelatococcus sp.]CAH1677912.1 conserved hypothetical protein [Hyphomicrobiales bacterium]